VLIFIIIALARAAKNIGDMNSKIVLSVGGGLHSITKDNLLRFPNSYFTGLLGSGNWKADGDNGSFYIDRDPFGFDLIMRYLRGIEINFFDMDIDLREAFRNHCDYFLLPIPQSLSSVDPRCFENQSGNIFRQLDDKRHFSMVHPRAPRSVMKFRILNLSESSETYISLYSLKNSEELNYGSHVARVFFYGNLDFVEKSVIPRIKLSDVDLWAMKDGDIMEVRLDTIAHNFSAYVKGNCIAWFQWLMPDDFMVVGVGLSKKGDSVELIV
jgi:hypothetical protein